MRKILTIIVSALAVFACGKKTAEIEPNNEFTVESIADEWRDDGSLEFTADGGSALIKVVHETSANAWKVRCPLNDAWVTFETELDDLTVLVAANDGQEDRSSYVDVVIGQNTRRIPILQHWSDVYTGPSFSVDGVEWSRTMPTVFTELYVRGEIDYDVLKDLKSILSIQVTPADIDLSATTYDGEMFPDLFKGVSGLKSIKFPSNIIGVAASAFENCANLEEVDLGSSIRYLSFNGGVYYTFSGSGLKRIVLPASLDGGPAGGGMDRSFVNAYFLEDVYYDCTWDPGTSYNWRTFQWGKGNDSAVNKEPKHADLTLTVGPNAFALPNNAFRNCLNLVRIVVEASENFSIYGNAFTNCDNVTEFVLKGAYPPKLSSSAYGGTFAANAAADAKKIIIPAGLLDQYKSHANWAAWQSMATAKGFIISDTGEGGEVIPPTPATDLDPGPETNALFSADNATWTAMIPDSFTTLYVKGMVTEVDLNRIKTVLNGQIVAAEVDMKESELDESYASMFPTTLAGCAKLKGFSFPGGTTKIASKAFQNCTALESIDLTGIRGIYGDKSDACFQGTVIKTLTVPETFLGDETTGETNVNTGFDRSFMNLNTLTYIYWNAKWAPGSGYNYRTFQWWTAGGGQNGTDIAPKTNDLKVIFGPATPTVACNMFRCHSNLTELVFESDDVTIWGYAFAYCGYLQTIELKGAVPPKIGSSNAFTSTGSALESGKKIIIPAGATAAYEASENWAAWKSMAVTNGYEIIDEAYVPPTPASISYSTDGSSWSNSIPDSFTKLYVKTTDGQLTLDDLTEIASAVTGQASAVEVDLSQTTYVSASFPKVFAGTGTSGDDKSTVPAGATDGNIKAIKFPSNITAIDSNAFSYCAKLESIDLSAITSIGSYAFYASGLKSVNVPNTVTSIGNRAFGFCMQLADIYYNAPMNATSGNNHIFTMRRTEITAAAAPAPVVETTLTIGPDGLLRGQDFDTNTNLVKVVLEDAKGISNHYNTQWYIRCYNIREFDCSAVPAPQAPAGSMGYVSTIGAAVTGEKIIRIPAGATDAYKDVTPWKELTQSYGFVFSDPSAPEVETVSYSVNGTDWVDAIPASFSTLYVKGALDDEAFAAVKAAVDAQASAVAIDLSAAVYSATEFPDTYKGDAKLGSIKFPSNVKTIAASAFEGNTALEAVDLTGITGIGGSAFFGSGLKSIDVPSSVTALGDQAFGQCYSLADVVYNSPVVISSNSRLFSGTSAVTDLTLNNPNNISRTITIGPDVTELPASFARYDIMTTKVVFEGATNIRQYGLASMTRLATIECKGGQPTGSANAVNSSTGNAVSGLKQILVPDGQKAAYSGTTPWSTLVGYGYVIVDPSAPIDYPTSYSVNGTDFVAELPATFTTLYVKGNLTDAVFATVKSAVDAQASAVTLDLSASVYSATEFPDTYKGDAKLGGIKFPSNVKTIAASAFEGNTALEAVDLTGITGIGDAAFQSSGLKAVTVPSSVTTMGTQVFRYCYSLADVTYNSPATVSGQSRLFSGTSAVTDLTLNNPNNISRTITVGSAVTTLPVAFAQYDIMTTKVVFEGATAISQAALAAMTRLATIECKGGQPTGAANAVASTTGNAVSGDKKILVPAGQKAAYEAATPWSSLVGYGYKVEEQ